MSCIYGSPTFDQTNPSYVRQEKTLLNTDIDKKLFGISVFSGIMLRVWRQNFIQRLPWGHQGLHFCKKQPITLTSRMAKLISLTHLSNNSHIIPLKTSKPKDQIQTNSLNGMSGREWAFILPTSSTVTVRGAWGAPQGVREYTWNKIVVGATVWHQNPDTLKQTLLLSQGPFALHYPTHIICIPNTHYINICHPHLFCYKLGKFFRAVLHDVDTGFI